MRSRGRIAALSVVAVVSIAAARFASEPVGESLASAAREYLESLTPELRARANPKLEDAARLDWSFVPRSRPGVALGEMSDPQRIAARGLMQASLSSRGMLKAEEIMSLDAILRELEKGQAIAASRDPLAYTITVYGEPLRGKAWGWKLEGHHVSLNFTAAGDRAVAVTPAFLGANPGEVRQGSRAGLRVLAIEEDLGRELAKSLDEAQRKEAVSPDAAPADILTGPGRSLDVAPSSGLACSKMTPQQQNLIDRLLEEFAGNMRQELANVELERIHKAGLEQIRFAWAGGLDRGQPHYYRISGPTFVIEYDNTQNGANHVHTVWHDRQRDFGQDALKDHYQSERVPASTPK
jgi:hypothetical protein